MGAKDEHRRGWPLADQRSLGKETGREGKGRMKKKNTPTFWLLGIRASQSSRQSHAQKVTLTMREPRGFLQELVLLCKALLSPG